MEKDYKKFTIYDILMVIIFAAGLYAYSYEGKLYLFLLAALIDLIFLYLQRQILKPYGINYNNLIKPSIGSLLAFAVAFLTPFANIYNWIIWIEVVLLALMLYLINKAVRKKLLTEHN